MLMHMHQTMLGAEDNLPWTKSAENITVLSCVQIAVVFLCLIIQVNVIFSKTFT